jgi:hypothetical protein
MASALRSLRRRLLFLAATAIAPAAKSAEPPSIGTLTVSDVDARCPASTELEARVDRLLGATGQARSRMRAAGIRASVHFAVEGSGHRAEIELYGARTGRRTLSDSAPDCRELAETAALALAILIDPAFVPPSEADAPRSSSAILAPLPAGGAVVQPMGAPHTAPETPARRPYLPPAPPAPQSITASAVSGGGITSRLTRPLALALAGGVALDFSRRFGARALALWVPPSEENEIPPGEIEFALLIGSVEACAHFPGLARRFRLSTCAGMSAGAIEAEAKNYVETFPTIQPFFAAVQAGFSAELPPSEAFGLWLDARGYFPLTRHRFEVEGSGNVQPSKIPGISAVIGLRVRLF